MQFDTTRLKPPPGYDDPDAYQDPLGYKNPFGYKAPANYQGEGEIKTTMPQFAPEWGQQPAQQGLPAFQGVQGAPGLPGQQPQQGQDRWQRMLAMALQQRPQQQQDQPPPPPRPVDGRPAFVAGPTPVQTSPWTIVTEAINGLMTGLKKRKPEDPASPTDGGFFRSMPPMGGGSDSGSGYGGVG